MNFPSPKPGEPPPGYDDSTIIAKQRLKLLVQEFEKELKKIEDYISAELPGQFQGDTLKIHLNSMIYSGKELGEEYLTQIEELTHCYHQFEKDPQIKNLHLLIEHLKRIKGLL